MKKIMFLVVLITTTISCRKEVSRSTTSVSRLEKGLYILNNLGRILYTNDVKSFSAITHTSPVMHQINAYYKNGKIYSFAANPYLGYTLSTSDDGVRWNIVSISDQNPSVSFSRETHEMVFSINGRFCTFMNTLDSVAVSDDGVKWKKYPPVANAKPRASESYYVRGDTLFMTGGYFAIPGTFTSEYLPEVWMTKDGWNWKKLSSQSVPPGYMIEETTMYPLNGVTYAVGQTLIGLKAKLFASTDGITWKIIDENPPYAYQNGSRYNMAIASFKEKVFFFKGLPDEDQLEYGDIWSFDGSRYQREVERYFGSNEVLQGSIVVVVN